jgi:ectoine hydroxylase-related dioxygenase (phytanoyl-CoA dioxygenase family)
MDSKCETTWYSDVISPNYVPDYVDLTERHKVDGIKSKKLIDSREFQDFDEALHKPVKRFTMKQGEVVLFNTDVWHRWNNRSNAERCILTLRVKNPGKFYFKDAKNALFNQAD